MLDHMTDGQASTCLEGGESIADDVAVTIAACDNGMLYDIGALKMLFDEETIDVIVWGQRVIQELPAILMLMAGWMLMKRQEQSKMFR